MRFSRIGLATLAALVLLISCGGGGPETPEKPKGDDPVVTAPATTAVQGPPPGAQLSPIQDLEVGACFNSVPDQASGERAVWTFNCADPHTFEAFAIIDYDADGSGRGSPYPSATVVQNFSEQACYAQFEPFVGIRWTVSDLDIKIWWPSNESWDRNDRQIVCAVVSTTEPKLTGTQRGVAR
ncbi:MAG TPA: septum formation family protein [Microthrixaceae bacterium]|nr:septum formation family protein [Microthrixaceae bacterium]